MENQIINCLIIVVLVWLFIRIIKNNTAEHMEDIPARTQRLHKYYEQIGNNVIYSKDFEQLYKIGKFYFNEKSYDLMLKYYRPIIDHYNNVNILNDDPLFISEDRLKELHELVQEDIDKSIDKQKTCKDYQSCLDTNLVLPTII